MTTQRTLRIKQPRDERIMELLFFTPCTSRQLWEASKAWPQPLRSLRSTQDILQKLKRAGWVKAYPYRSSTRLGGEYYYKLTKLGYRVWLDDQHASPPTKRFFQEIADGHHHHAHWQARLVVHFLRGLHQRGLRVERIYPENTLTIEVEGETPHLADFYCEVVSPTGKRFPLLWEIDCSSETLVSSAPRAKDWQRLHRIYDAYADRCKAAGQPLPHVLVFTTKSRQRAVHIVEGFRRQTRDPNRLLLQAVFAEAFLESTDPICQPIFIDHRRWGVPLLSPRSLALAPQTVEPVPMFSYADHPFYRPTAATA